jgi:acetyltransferase
MRRHDRGSIVVTSVRRALGSDAPAVAEFLEGLSAETAFRRFFTGLGHPPQALSERLVVRDADHGVWLGVEEGRVVGHASWTRDLSTSELVFELAVVVADAFQGRGLGTQLILRAAEEAVQSGAQTLRFVVHGDNREMVRWLTRLFPDLTVRFEGGAMVCDVAHASKRSFPVVLRPAKSPWALEASASS